MILTAEERTKFADYLEQCAMDSEGIAVQLEKLDQGSIAKAKKLRLEASAQRIVSAILRTTETERI